MQRLVNGMDLCEIKTVYGGRFMGQSFKKLNVSFNSFIYCKCFMGSVTVKSIISLYSEKIELTNFG